MFSIMICCRQAVFTKALLPIDFKDEGIDTLTSFVQLKNAPFPMEVNDEDMFTFARFAQSLKASFPMDVKEDSI